MFGDVSVDRIGGFDRDKMSTKQRETWRPTLRVCRAGGSWLAGLDCLRGSSLLVCVQSNKAKVNEQLVKTNTSSNRRLTDLDQTPLEEATQPSSICHFNQKEKSQSVPSRIVPTHISNHYNLRINLSLQQLHTILPHPIPPLVRRIQRQLVLFNAFSNIIRLQLVQSFCFVGHRRSNRHRIVTATCHFVRGSSMVYLTECPAHVCRAQYRCCTGVRVSECESGWFGEGLGGREVSVPQTVEVERL